MIPSLPLPILQIVIQNRLVQNHAGLLSIVNKTFFDHFDRLALIALCAVTALGPFMLARVASTFV